MGKVEALWYYLREGCRLECRKGTGIMAIQKEAYPGSLEWKTVRSLNISEAKHLHNWLGEAIEQMEGK